MRIVFWLGVVLAADALVGLLGLKHWRKLVPESIDIGRIATVEAIAALALLAVYFAITLT